MNKRGSLEESAELGEINISPMIDMVFILLIFFIVTTFFVEEPGVEVRRPPALTAMDLEKNSILIAITEGNQVVWGGSEIGIQGVRPTITRLLRQNDTMPVILQVDQFSSSGIVVRVVDEAKLGGAEKISISTKIEG